MLFDAASVFCEFNLVVSIVFFASGYEVCHSVGNEKASITVGTYHFIDMLFVEIIVDGKSVSLFLFRRHIYKVVGREREKQLFSFLVHAGGNGQALLLAFDGRAQINGLETALAIAVCVYSKKQVGVFGCGDIFFELFPFCPMG